MSWWRRRPDAVDDLEARLAAVHAAAIRHEQRAQHLTIALELTTQAKTRAEQDAQYWRERAERFIDQIGLRQGILAAPTMTEPPPSADRAQTVFDALGIGEVNSTHGRPATSPAAVVGVDPAVAGAAVRDLLNRTGG